MGARLSFRVQAERSAKVGFERRCARAVLNVFLPQARCCGGTSGAPSESRFFTVFGALFVADALVQCGLMGPTRARFSF